VGAYRIETKKSRNYEIAKS